MGRRSPWLLSLLLCLCIVANIACSLLVASSFRKAVSMNFLLKEDNPPAIHVTGLSRLLVEECGLSLTRLGTGGQTLVLFQLDQSEILELEYAFVCLAPGLTVKFYLNGDVIAQHERLPQQQRTDPPLVNKVALPCRKGGNTLLVLYQGTEALAAFGDHRVAFSTFRVASR